jgi:hypothetical protein
MSANDAKRAIFRAVSAALGQLNAGFFEAFPFSGFGSPALS